MPFLSSKRVGTAVERSVEIERFPIRSFLFKVFRLRCFVCRMQLQNYAHGILACIHIFKYSAYSNYCMFLLGNQNSEDTVCFTRSIEVTNGGDMDIN